MAAMAEEGGDPDAWARANPHLGVLAAESTTATVLAEEYSELAPAAQLFTLKAAEKNLRPLGRSVVEKYFKPGQVWSFAEVTVCNDRRPKVRFDIEYRQAIKEEQRPVSGTDEFYARVVRVGGERPTAKLEIGNETGTFRVTNQEIAKKLANRLFETVKIFADVRWDSRTLEILDIVVTGIDEDWQDIHLAQVIDRYGGRLPLDLSVGSTAELLAEREEARR